MNPKDAHTLPTLKSIAEYASTLDSSRYNSTWFAGASYIYQRYALPLAEENDFLNKRIASVEEESAAAKKCIFEYLKIEKVNEKLKTALDCAKGELDEIGHFGYNSNASQINYEKACIYLTNKAFAAVGKIRSIMQEGEK